MRSVDFYLCTHREKLESRDLLALVVSVDLLDHQDPLVWLDPLASLDERYDPSRLHAIELLFSVILLLFFQFVYITIGFFVGNPW